MSTHGTKPPSDIVQRMNRIATLANAQHLNERELGREFFELQLALATPGCKGKLNAFIQTLPIARSSVYRQIAKHKESLGLKANRPKRDNSRSTTTSVKKSIVFSPANGPRINMLLSTIASAVPGKSDEELILRLLEAEYARAVGITKAEILGPPKICASAADPALPVVDSAATQPTMA